MLYENVFCHWGGTYSPECCISGWSWRARLNHRMWLCLNRTARAMSGRAMHMCLWRQCWWALYVSQRNIRHCCRSLQSMNLGKDKHAGGGKVTLGSELQTKDQLSQKLSLNFSINLSTEVSISFLFILIFSERLHQPIRVKRLKRLGRPLCFSRLF